MTSSQLRVIVKSRPGADNAPTGDTFQVESCDLPGDPAEGQVQIKSTFLSLDPAMRCRLNEVTGVHYVTPWPIGETVAGFGGIGTVVKSNNSDFQEGDIVTSLLNWPWTAVFNIKPDPESFPLTKVDVSLRDSPQLVLSLFGLTGLTALLGLQEKGHLTPGTNQAFVVSGAAGATGNLAGQMARLLGAAKVVGICGTDDKCAHLTSKLGFDAAINYKSQDVAAQLREACPDGVHCYFDNVGGELSETVVSQMVSDSHVVLCGQIAMYNKDLPYPPPLSEQMTQTLEQKHITRDRFLVLNYTHKNAEGLQQLQQWYAEGKLQVPEVIFEGLEKAPEAFVNMMTSVKQDKVGKQMVPEVIFEGLEKAPEAFVNMMTSVKQDKVGKQMVQVL